MSSLLELKGGFSLAAMNNGRRNEHFNIASHLCMHKSPTSET